MLGSKTLVVLSLLLSHGLAQPVTGENASPIPAYPVVDLSSQETYNAVEASPDTLVKRRPVWKNLVCGKGPNDYGRAPTWASKELVEKIRTWKGTPKCPPNTCVRIAYGLGSAQIWLCNNNPVELRLQGYADIADGAKVIADNCVDEALGHRKDPTTLLLVGQRFAEGYWNVILRGDVQ